MSRVQLHDHSNIYQGGKLDRSGALVGGSEGGGGTGGGTSLAAHGDLSGLGSDDHSAYLKRTGGEVHTVYAHGSMGATETFDSVNGNIHTGTLDANCVFTLTAPTSGVGCVIELHILASGTRTWTWPGSVAWPGGVTPDSPADTEVSRVLLETIDGGTTWYGAVVGGGSSSVASLDDLTDVTITAATTGDRLRFDGSQWVNTTLIWVPVMVEDAATGLWYVTVTGDGDAVMTEV